MDADLLEKLNSMDIDKNDLVNIDLATGGKLGNNSGVSKITEAVFSFVAIELLIVNLQDIAANNVCNLICQELCVK